ncbi:hypothetical protein HaLaN_09882 [Haematococcus lacustris]|uniref:Uncharacterized protein n=1 Tax=Haematococcus lacustris TaxID=44745 RepID=A0A699YUK8_HAELA|nr:hypothetical protein HaLaN_09882 [Haematococcus lacustris]
MVWARALALGRARLRVNTRGLSKVGQGRAGLGNKGKLCCQRIRITLSGAWRLEGSDAKLLEVTQRDALLWQGW